MEPSGPRATRGRRREARGPGAGTAGRAHSCPPVGGVAGSAHLKGSPGHTRPFPGTWVPGGALPPPHAAAGAGRRRGAPLRRGAWDPASGVRAWGPRTALTPAELGGGCGALSVGNVSTRAHGPRGRGRPIGENERLSRLSRGVRGPRPGASGGRPGRVAPGQSPQRPGPPRRPLARLLRPPAGRGFT